MCDVDALAKQVNGSLADKRSQIDTLVRSRRLLKRLEFLFELPKKLEVAVSEGRHEDAVSMYEAADAVLSSHGHVASLRDIHDDAPLESAVHIARNVVGVELVFEASSTIVGSQSIYSRPKTLSALFSPNP